MHNLNAPRFDVTVEWPTSETDVAAPTRPNTFSRAHTITAPHVTHNISGSSAKQFRGDETKWNPEQLLLAAVAQCHMLTFLFLAHKEGISVLSYSDSASGTISIDADGVGGQFSEITLNPKVVVQGNSREEKELRKKLLTLNESVKNLCFIRRSVNVPINEILNVQFVKQTSV